MGKLLYLREIDVNCVAWLKFAGSHYMLYF